MAILFIEIKTWLWFIKNLINSENSIICDNSFRDQALI